ncbi:tho complex subunit 7 domain-containing protein [Sarocladium implicatum]|nr:tho complex subunit 7 domain-containing protein [Sarocladium implicatum]
MASWELLDVEAEQSLHKSRLLSVEERPFKRITKRMTTISSLVTTAIHGPEQSSQDPPSDSHDQLKDDITFDFAAFDSSILRLQFLHDANARERARYAADQQRILAECQSVRDSNAQLREHLDAARATLAQRKKFDELAEKITMNKMLKPREDQRANLAKLEEECRELERESQAYNITWGERRDQFNRIMDEGMLLRAQIRDEKEEVDRREGMDEGEDSDAAPTPARTPGRGLTPKPDGTTPRIEVDEPQKPTTGGDTDATPQNATNSAGTPMAGTNAVSTPQPDSLRPTSRSESRAPSQEPSPAPQAGEERKDIDMAGNDTTETPRSGEAETAEVSVDKMEVDN